ncbi:hypothetical protein KBA73_02440 [Patescibacteria group bacterium]|nr:hypothetical protein [Patescibacteria group bacterium]
MFGVNRFGEDVLAGQFRGRSGGGSVGERPQHPSEFDHEVQTTYKFLHDNPGTVAAYEARAMSELLTELKRTPDKDEVKARREALILARARKIVDDGRLDEMGHASRAAILRT